MELLPRSPVPRRAQSQGQATAACCHPASTSSAAGSGPVDLLGDEVEEQQTTSQRSDAGRSIALRTIQQPAASDRSMPLQESPIQTVLPCHARSPCTNASCAFWHWQAGDPLFRPGQQLRRCPLTCAGAAKVHVIQGIGVRSSSPGRGASATLASARRPRPPAPRAVRPRRRRGSYWPASQYGHQDRRRSAALPSGSAAISRSARRGGGLQFQRRDGGEELRQAVQVPQPHHRSSAPPRRCCRYRPAAAATDCRPPASPLPPALPL